MTHARHSFLSYAKEDRAEARRINRRLVEEGVNTWFDEDRLLPGQDWQSTIFRAIRDARFFVVFLTPRAVSKKGFINREIREALTVWQEHPSGSSFLIPVVLERCEVPDDLRGVQWADVSEEGGLDQLLAALRSDIGSDQVDLRTRAEALFNSYIVSVTVRAFDTQAPLRGARVDLNEIEVPDDLIIKRLKIIRIKPLVSLSGVTDRNGGVRFGLPSKHQVGEQIYLTDGSRRYIVSVSVPGYRVKHAMLAYRDPMMVMMKVLVNVNAIERQRGWVFDEGEAEGREPDETVTLELFRQETT